MHFDGVFGRSLKSAVAQVEAGRGGVRSEMVGAMRSFPQVGKCLFNVSSAEFVFVFYLTSRL